MYSPDGVGRPLCGPCLDRDEPPQGGALAQCRVWVETFFAPPALRGLGRGLWAALLAPYLVDWSVPRGLPRPGSGGPVRA